MFLFIPSSGYYLANVVKMIFSQNYKVKMVFIKEQCSVIKEGNKKQLYPIRKKQIDLIFNLEEIALLALVNCIYLWRGGV